MQTGAGGARAVPLAQQAQWQALLARSPIARARNFICMRVIDVQGRQLAIGEDHSDSAENEAGAVVWDAAIVLASYLQGGRCAGRA